jgi:dTDP-4-amino-4,6-dideoxygalactose transaminase
MSNKQYISTLFKQQCGTENIIFAGRANTLLYAFFKTLPKNSTVIFPAIMCPSPLFVASYAGINCYLCDIDKETGLLDLSAVERSIQQSNNKVSAVLSVNLYGIRPNNKKLHRFCQDNDIFLIEDAAQGWDFNSLHKDVDLSVLSFGAKKNIDIGGGGVLLAKNDALYARISHEYEQIETTEQDTIKTLSAYYAQLYYLLQDMEKNLAGSQKVFHHFADIFKPLYFPNKNNIDIDELKLQLSTLDEKLATRNYWVKEYKQLFNQFPQLTPIISNDFQGSCWRYSVLFDSQQRDTLAEYLRRQEIDVSCWYTSLAKLGFNNAYLTSNHNEEFGDSIMNFWIDDMSHEKLTRLENALQNYFKDSQ